MTKICIRCKKEYIPKYTAQEYCNNKYCLKEFKKKNKNTIKRRYASTKAHSVKTFSPKRPIQTKCERNERAFTRHLKSKYNLSLIEFIEMKTRQDNRCAICGALSKLLVDHDHATGSIRALLCNSCNAGLGLFRDSIGVMENAVNYLKFHKK